jgi:hypothetical protein
MCHGCAMGGVRLATARTTVCGADFRGRAPAHPACPQGGIDHRTGGCPPGRTGSRSGRHRPAAGRHDSYLLPPPSAGRHEDPRVAPGPRAQHQPKALGRARREGFECGPGGQPRPCLSWMPGEALRRRVCETRRPLGVKAAHHHADQRRRRGVPASAYGCVFCGHWHVGPPLSMDRIED